MDGLPYLRQRTQYPLEEVHPAGQGDPPFQNTWVPPWGTQDPLEEYVPVGH